MKATLTGTAGEDREGGVAVDSAGNVYEALSAEGPVDGQPNAARKDVVLDQVRPDRHEALDEGVRHRAASIAPTGSRSTRRGIRSSPATRRATSTAAHAGNTSDDMFVDEVRPERQPRVGDAGRARRPPTAATASRSTATARSTPPATRRARSAGRNVGDKDVFVAQARGCRWRAALDPPVRRRRRGQGDGGRRRRRHASTSPAWSTARSARRCRARRPAASTASSRSYDASGNGDAGRGSSARPPRTRRGAWPPTRPATRPSPASRPATCSRRTPGDKDIDRRALRPDRRDHAARPVRHGRQRQGRERRARRCRQHVRRRASATATSRRTSATSTRC